MPPQTDALAALRDIHLPEAVSFWPLAPGWWGALALLISLVVACVLLVRRRRRSARRAALRMLGEAEQRFRSDGDVRALAVALSALLRRVALFRFPRRDVAALHGNDWLRFLADESRSNAFPADVVFGLERSLYAKHTDPDEVDGEVWIAATSGWIRRMT